MYATIVTAALFSGIIFNDLIQGADKTTILKHFLFGLVASTAMAFLTLRGADLAAWGLLLIPVLAVLISSIIAAMKAPTAAPATAPLMPPPTPKKPEPEPTINTPIDTPYMKTICYEVDQPPCPVKDTSKAQCTLLENGDIAPPTGTCPESKPEPVKPKCTPKTEESAPKEEPITPAQATDLLKAVTSKLTPSVTCPSG